VGQQSGLLGGDFEEGAMHARSVDLLREGRLRELYSNAANHYVPGWGAEESPAAALWRLAKADDRTR
jgi:hypothetical protein